jgi:hypothetical protein
MSRALVALAFCVLPAIGRAEPAPAQELTLDAHGGASMQVPAWRSVRKDAAVAVLEQSADLSDPAAPKPFYVLVLSLEEGPTAAADWDKIREQMVASASRNGRALTLTLGAPVTDIPGFEARRLAGEFTGSNGRKVAMDILALAGGKRLVTVGLIAEVITDVERTLLGDIAKTVRIKN